MLVVIRGAVPLTDTATRSGQRCGWRVIASRELLARNADRRSIGVAVQLVDAVGVWLRIFAASARTFLLARDFAPVNDVSAACRYEKANWRLSHALAREETGKCSAYGDISHGLLRH